MGAAAITLSSTVVVGLLLWWAIGHWGNWTTAAIAVMFGNGIAGTTLGAISLVTGKSIVELMGAAVRSANRIAGGNPAVTVTPALALVAALCWAASSSSKGKLVAVLGIVVGTVTVGTTIGTIASQANTAVTDGVGEGVRTLGQQVGGGGEKGYSQAPPPAIGPEAGMNIGGGVTR